MNDWEMLFLAPFGVLIAGALITISLERVGTPLGARKTGRRTHMMVIAMVACLAAAVQWGGEIFGLDGEQVLFEGAFIFSRSALLMSLILALTTSVILLPALSRLRAMGTEKGELFAFICVWLAFDALALFADDILIFAAATMGGYALFTAMCGLDRSVARSAEASVKTLYTAGGMLVFLALAALFTFAKSGSTRMSVLAALPADAISVIPLLMLVIASLAFAFAVPTHMAHTDAVQGAPPFVSAIFISGAFAKTTMLTLRLQEAVQSLPPLLQTVFDAVLIAALLLPGLIALDQRQISRMLAQLTGTAGVVIVAAGRLSDTTSIFASGIVSICAIAAAFCALGAFEHVRSELTTWERLSGLGKKHPYFTLVFLWLLASLVGFPGTALFTVRLRSANFAFASSHFWLGAALICSIAVAAAPVFRLGILTFARTPSSVLDIDNKAYRVSALALFAGVLVALSIGAKPGITLIARLLGHV